MIGDVVFDVNSIVGTVSGSGLLYFFIRVVSFGKPGRFCGSGAWKSQTPSLENAEARGVGPRRFFAGMRSGSNESSVSSNGFLDVLAFGLLLGLDLVFC